MPDDNTIRFTFRTLDTNLQKIKYIAGYNATSMNYEIDRQIKKYVHRHASDSQNVLGQTTIRTNEAVMNSLKHIAQLHGFTTTRQLEYIMEEYIQEFEDKHGKIDLDE